MEANDPEDENVFFEVESVIIQEILDEVSDIDSEKNSDINHNQNIFQDVMSEISGSIEDENQVTPLIWKSVKTPRPTKKKQDFSSRKTSPLGLSPSIAGSNSLDLSSTDWNSPQSTVNLFSSNRGRSCSSSSSKKPKLKPTPKTNSKAITSNFAPDSSSPEKIDPLTKENLLKHQQSVDTPLPPSILLLNPNHHIKQTSEIVQPISFHGTKKNTSSSHSTVQRYVLYEKVLSQLKTVKTRPPQKAYFSFYQNLYGSNDETTNGSYDTNLSPTISASLSHSYDHVIGGLNKELLEDHYGLPCHPDDISDSSQNHRSESAAPSPSSLLVENHEDDAITVDHKPSQTKQANKTTFSYFFHKTHFFKDSKIEEKQSNEVATEACDASESKSMQSIPTQPPDTKAFEKLQTMIERQDNARTFERLSALSEDDFATKLDQQYMTTVKSLYFTQTSMKTSSIQLPQKPQPTPPIESDQKNENQSRNPIPNNNMDRLVKSRFAQLEEENEEYEDGVEDEGLEEELAGENDVEVDVEENEEFSKVGLDIEDNFSFLDIAIMY